jgi:hypothetical protein
MKIVFMLLSLLLPQSESFKPILKRNPHKCQQHLKDMGLNSAQRREVKKIVLRHSLRSVSHACFVLHSYTSFSVCTIFFNQNHTGPVWLVCGTTSNEVAELPVSRSDFKNYKPDYIIDSLILKNNPSLAQDPQRVAELRKFVQKEWELYDGIPSYNLAPKSVK